MRNFLFMIGSTDDFDSQEALERALDPRSDEARGNEPAVRLPSSGIGPTAGTVDRAAGFCSP